MEKTVRFSGWTPNPKSVNIGMERDNKVFTLQFEGLPEYPGGTTYLHIDLGSKAESIALVDGCATIGRTVTQFEGEHEAYLETLAQGDVVWHSDVLMVVVGRLPLIGDQIEQAYPTAFEQVLTQTAADRDAAAESAKQAADTAAGIVTQETARQTAEEERQQAEAARDTAEADREKAETARAEAETAREKAEAARAESAVGLAEKEAARETAEQQRVEAEQQRVKAEEARAVAENARTTAEQGREMAEVARVDAEAERQAAAREAVAGLDAVREEWKERLDSGALKGEKGEKGDKGDAGADGKDGSDGLDAPQIDDTSINATNPWSSEQIIDTLCPPLEESGNPVVCYPVANSNLNIVASWEPTQAGSGTPSPDNIRPISGRDTIAITHQEANTTTALTLPRTIYGGEVDAQTGEGQETWKLLTLDGKEDWTIPTTNDYFVWWAREAIPTSADNKSGVCSHYKYQPNTNHEQSLNAQPNGAVVAWHINDTYATIAEWKSYLAAQYAAGTPVQIAYKLEQPVPFTASGGAEIKALAGTNTLLTDGDSLSISSRADPIHIIQQLQTASTAATQALNDATKAIADF